MIPLPMNPMRSRSGSPIRSAPSVASAQVTGGRPFATSIEETEVRDAVPRHAPRLRAAGASR